MNVALSPCWSLVLLIIASSSYAATTSTFSSQSIVPAFVSRNPEHRTSTARKMASIDRTVLTVGELVGSGSYGAIHLVRDSDGDTAMIGKRSLTQSELSDNDDPKERHKRCQYYFDVEQHCFEKMQGSPEANIPTYKGVLKDEEGLKWMVFDVISRHSDAKAPAPTLGDVIKLDWSYQHESESSSHHHLHLLQEELGMDKDSSFGDTLDVSIMSLLKGLSFVHSKGIVHRDIKPGNLLCDASKQSLVLIDFGSAADMDPVANGIFGKKRVGLEEDRVAVSPIFSAPEVFVKEFRAPLNFDMFSTGLIFCQLLFNYLDERTDAAFFQQLKDLSYDLNAWLDFELTAKLRPDGLEDALEYLAERPGLWSLLGEMLRRDPEQRVSSINARDRFETILSAVGTATADAESDGSFFESVVQASQACDIEFDEEFDDAMTMPRPLQFVATFKRNMPLGLMLSEVEEEYEDKVDDDDETRQKWEEATADALEGHVFVRGVVEGGQADEMGIFDVGDRLQGIGELPLGEGGFGRVLDMLERQPQSARNVKLHFDRKAVGASQLSMNKEAPHLARISDQGTWSVKGRRQYQEDRFVLHEIHNEDKNILIAGVFDGHGGTSASTSAAQLFPSLLSEYHYGDLQKVMRLAWDTTCNTYRGGCDEMGECVADYDPKQGILVASTGAQDLVAGTTAAVVTMSDPSGGEFLEAMNCGDSRIILVGKPFSGKSVVHFASKDHSPACDSEKKRLQAGVESGLGYSIPQCSLSQWRMKVGDYQYAVSRSLEGSFATSKGIVSDAEMTKINVSEMLQQRENGILVIASDGLFEVMDSEEAGRDVIAMRERGMSAGDSAKGLCKIALDKGTNDNVSAVVVYLE